jgi:hypothetical protein
MIRFASPNTRLLPKVDRSPKSPKLAEALARARVPAADAWLSSAEAKPSVVAIGAAAAAP